MQLLAVATATNRDATRHTLTFIPPNTVSVRIGKSNLCNHTLHVCIIRYFANDTLCAKDYCSVLFPQSGQFDSLEQTCVCRPFFYLVDSVPVVIAGQEERHSVCGCPAGMQLDRCTSDLDDRCVMPQGDDMFRCICPRGFAFDTVDPICEAIECEAQGTIPGKKRLRPF
jgi:hypothetical protein